MVRAAAAFFLNSGHGSVLNSGNRYILNSGGARPSLQLLFYLPNRQDKGPKSSGAQVLRLNMGIHGLDDGLWWPWLVSLVKEQVEL